MQKSNRHDNNIIHMGARNLVESMYRSGSINRISYSSLSAREGTRTHQAFYNRLSDEYRTYKINSEYSLNYLGYFSDERVLHDELTAVTNNKLEIDGIEVSGRADLLLLPVDDPNVVSFNNFEDYPEVPFIMEVKTVNRPLNEINPNGEKIHWYQAKLYSFMYWNEQIKTGVDIPSSIPYALAYVSVETLDSEFLFEWTTWEELSQWFTDTCYSYLSLAINIQERIKLRDESIENLTFPYEYMRSGQSELIQQVANSVSRMTPLIAQAPTGTGKTISTLYPAIQELPDSMYEHIFYLTAKNSTKIAAENTLKDLRKNSSLFLKSITITAKEKICPYHKESTDCPYSINYYDNLPDALEELWPVQDLDASIIMKASEKHKVCAFELSLDLALQCDVIIADYNYAFDPKVQLERFFGKSAGSQILLVDEAHNLVDRSREMYSASLDSNSFNYALSVIPSEVLKIYGLTQNIVDYFKQLDDAFKANEDGFDKLEASPEGDVRVVSTDDFRATTNPLKNFAALLLPWVQEARLLLESLDNPKLERFFIELIGESKFFMRIIDEFWSMSYISAARKTNKGVYIRIICLDVSEQLSASYINKHAAVFFSATLRPIEYFQANFCGNERDNRPYTLELYSPFPPENLEVYTAKHIQTTYKMRNQTASELAKTLALTILLRRGQQFIYFPSFTYMKIVTPLLKKILNGQNIIWAEQKSGMSNKEREDFLKLFENPSEDKTVVGFVVLGGIFGEGIDLVGKSLTGVSIVSVGLPQISPERNIMSEYYNFIYNQGFNFAYIFPAINKVLQAAGRLIRSETDQGFILLIDERFSKPEYRNLLPEDWDIQEVESSAELKDLLLENKLDTHI